MRSILRSRHAAGLAAAITVMLCVFAIALLYGPRHLASPPPAEESDPGDATLAFGRSHDLDGDGRPDSVRANEAGLVAQSATGSRLLVLEGGAPLSYRVISMGGQFPVLFVETDRGEYAAYAYAPGQGLMQAVTWPDGQMRGYGELREDGSLKQTVVGATARSRIVQLQLDRLQLETVARVHQPLTEPANRPSLALAALVEAVALGLEGEMAVHMPEAEAAEDFWRRWEGRLPAGTAHVVQADQVDAGAGEGHLVPVTVWMAGEKQVAGLQGEAEFAAAPAGGVRVRQIHLQPIKLQVDSWEAAAQRLKEARPEAGEMRRSGAPFLGVYRFESDQGRFAVDAATGRIDQE